MVAIVPRMRIRKRCVLVLLCIALILSFGSAEIIPNWFVVEVAQDCESTCLRNVAAGAVDAGCTGAAAQKLGGRPNDEDTFLSVHCDSMSSTLTEKELKTKIEEHNIKVIDIEMDNTVDAAQAMWNIDEVDSNPTDGQRCTTSNLGDGVTVLVLDSGCTPTGNQTYCKSFLGFGPVNSCLDVNGHGTAVASVVSDPVFGVAPRADIGCLRVLSFDGRGSVRGVVAAMYESMDIADATNRKIVVNLSLGGRNHSQILTTVVRRLARRVDTVVVASGNEGVNIANSTISSAADNEKIFAIAAHDENGNQGVFSNTGELVKITAPGVNITTRRFTSGLIGVSGTSFSAPHVSGAAAALLSDGKEVSLATLTTGTETVTFANNLEPIKKLSYDCTTQNPTGQSSSTSQLSPEVLGA